ncbi:MAG TPA: hypothetical protein VK348_11590, partial [Planctomycetota bacterium]|nr:hypothetical protein [Planctomycetota bacterium]
MNRASLAAAAAWIVVVLTAAGTAQKPAAEAPGPAVPVVNPYRFADWKDGFPVALDWPSPSSGKWYERSRRQALERVVANLQGNTRA